MPNIPPLITHTPNLDPLYKSVASAGIVKAVVAGTNIAVNSADPANPIVSAPGQTAFFYDSGAITLPTAPAAGTTITNVGAVITVPRTGLYLASCMAGINVSAIAGATFGLADDIGFELLPASATGEVNPAITLRPYTMPNTGASGVDYGMDASAVFRMVAGINYQPKYFTDNVSTTMAIPADSSIRMTLTALC